MVRAEVCANLSFPYAQNVTGGLLDDQFWEASGQLERYGFKTSSDSMLHIMVPFGVTKSVKFDSHYT
jgi:hypothetical protein